MKKSFLIPLLALTLFFALGSYSTFAQDGGANTGNDSGVNKPISFQIKNPFRGGDSLFALLKALVDNIVLPVGAVLSMLAFVYAGFKYVMAQGNATAIAEANRALLYAAIGTAVLLGSWVFATAICNTINALGGPVCNTP